MKKYNDVAFALASMADHLHDKGTTPVEKDQQFALRRMVAILEDHAIEDEKLKLRIAELERQVQKLTARMGVM